MRPASSEERQNELKLRSQLGTAALLLHMTTPIAEPRVWRHHQNVIDGVASLHNDPDRRAEWCKNVIDGVASLHNDPDRSVEEVASDGEFPFFSPCKQVSILLTRGKIHVLIGSRLDTLTTPVTVHLVWIDCR